MERFGCYCGAGFFADRKRVGIVESVEQFCSVKCLLSFLEAKKDPDRTTFVLKNTFPIHVQDGYEVYSRKLDLWFRSKFELSVASFFTFCGIPWSYECRGVPFAGRGSFYVPDFLLADYGFLVEVKGRWIGSGRKKFLRASKKLPFILIQNHLAKELSAYALS